MSSHTPSRAASLAERRASAAVRQKSRPTSAASPLEQGNRSESRAGIKRKTATVTTTTETKHDVTSQETFIRRTNRSPVKTADDSFIDRKAEKLPQHADGPSGKKGVSDSAILWSPQATLLSPTTAPLSSRVSVPPLAQDAPVSLRPHPLNSLSLADQERAIIQDLLFVFMGFEGQYIHFTDGYQPLDEKSRLSGPQFKIENGLDPSLRDLANSMLKIATCYCAVEAFVEVQSREDFGSVNHALCATMRKLLVALNAMMRDGTHWKSPATA